MSVTTKNYVDATLGLTQDFWAPIIERELRERTLWSGLLMDPNYTLSKVKGGDTYKVTRINKPTSSIRTVGTNADSFETNVLTSTQNDLVVNKRCVSAVEFEDLAMLMSQLESEDSQIREALLADVRQQANDWIIANISPSTSAPDHSIASVTDFSFSQLSAIRTLAATAKWKSSGEPWYLLASPSYYSDMLDDTTLGAANAMGTATSPVLEGMFNFKRLGFNIVEDDALDLDVAYAFIPSFMRVMMGEPTFNLSPLHAQKKFGYVLSVDFVLGVKQMDDERVIKIYNS